MTTESLSAGQTVTFTGNCLKNGLGPGKLKPYCIGSRKLRAKLFELARILQRSGISGLILTICGGALPLRASTTNPDQSNMLKAVKVPIRTRKPSNLPGPVPLGRLTLSGGSYYLTKFFLVARSAIRQFGRMTMS